MGFIELTVESAVRSLPLGWSTLVGRHPGMTWRIDHADVPLVWLELRWFPDAACWGWRALSEVERTQGVQRRAPALPPGWSRADPYLRVRIGAVSLRVADPAPPEPFLVDLLHDTPIVGAALWDIVTVHDDKAQPVAGSAVCAQPLLDHGVIAQGGHLYRVHLPTPRIGGEDRFGALGAPGCTLTIMEPEPRCFEATFEWVGREGEIRLSGEFARILVPYALVRVEGLGDGWLDTEGAHALWLEAGGNPRSPPNRLLWLRAHLQQHLAREGVSSPGLAFERRTRGNQRSFRLGMQPDNIEILAPSMALTDETAGRLGSSVTGSPKTAMH
jgi:hypothetical protein